MPVTVRGGSSTAVRRPYQKRRPPGRRRLRHFRQEHSREITGLSPSRYKRLAPSLKRTLTCRTGEVAGPLRRVDPRTVVISGPGSKRLRYPVGQRVHRPRKPRGDGRISPRRALRPNEYSFGSQLVERDIADGAGTEREHGVPARHQYTQSS